LTAMGVHAMESTCRQFRYLADPVFVVASLCYVVGRWGLRAHGIGGTFTTAYLNDVLCLPIFVPLSLWLQRVMGVRHGDDYPRAWEILQHAAVFSILFELILPRFPLLFRSTADPLDAVAYLAGGAIGYVAWRMRDRIKLACRRGGEVGL
jgi:hypothetical protein